mgnify:CR=1 FL=1
MDNDDETIFSSPKSLIGLLFIGTISIYVIYWIYNNIIKDNQANQNQNNILNIFNANPNTNNNNKKKQIIKQKMSINMTLLMKDSKKSILEDINVLYNLFDKLSDYYNLYLLIYIEDNINAEKIKDELLKYLEPIINDNIIYHHRIIFCTSIEGMTAIIRSLDPFVHIENNNYIVVQLIRYINEFWFVKKKNEKDEILKKVESDSNNAKQNIKDLMDKIKFYSDFNQVIDKEIKSK